MLEPIKNIIQRPNIDTVKITLMDRKKSGSEFIYMDFKEFIICISNIQNLCIFFVQRIGYLYIECTSLPGYISTDCLLW